MRKVRKTQQISTTTSAVKQIISENTELKMILNGLQTQSTAI